ncbi:NAD+ synthase [Picrophilus oshimae]|uniref:NH(3)-dependent NAD(+) synthetase n=1 Tax=Picrophilus torridus (strain ATCC 700027 / DSM 9790 / JCM 10055 / NBRC 100828 / KAW 2/3) TaxID=1122961 RepID=A0A8G2L7N4_PICTO|nr:NAD+ synthase [Picrophilus oshimae]SMD31195.1 NH(3)-dependent NAD(+) synthetase [Picrophilus oshimae DSM 9789]
MVERLDGVFKSISDFLRQELNGKNAVIGVSSGIDSALVLTILSKAIDKDRIHAFFMPDRFTRSADFDDIRSLEGSTGVKINEINIENIVNGYKSTLGIKDKKYEGNIRSRVRSVILYYNANLLNGLVVGTTNRTEYLIGYFTKYGDSACDLEPIEHLYKSDVRELASYLKVPESIIRKKPSAGLWSDQYDEDELGMGYEELDSILKDLFEKKTGILDDRYKMVYDMYIRSQHKRKLPKSMMNDDFRYNV